MDLWRRAADPWGQDVLIGVSWDLMWAAIIVAGAFLVGHALWIKTRPAEAPAETGDAPPAPRSSATPAVSRISARSRSGH